MNLGLLFKLAPMAGRIETALATLRKYMDNPEVPKALALVQQIEADPEVHAAIETMQEVTKVLAESQS